jgi:hypothetical protein
MKLDFRLGIVFFFPMILLLATVSAQITRNSFAFETAHDNSGIPGYNLGFSDIPGNLDFGAYVAEHIGGTVGIHAGHTGWLIIP